jgi:hypothetical protein
MVGKMVLVDVIYSPWCFIEAPEENYKKELEEKWKIKIREFNLWEIDDDELYSLPKHITSIIRKMRNPNNQEQFYGGGGTLFFLNGEKLDLSPALKWPQIEKKLEETEIKGA